MYFLHKHKCGSKNCRTVWEHDPFEIINEKEAHTCPKCGEEEYFIFGGEDQPEVKEHIGKNSDGVDYKELLEDKLEFAEFVTGYTRKQILSGIV